jgi:type I restriction enzyme S subunit
VSTLPKGWSWARIGDVGEIRLGKMLDRAKNQGEPVEYLRNINVRWFDFDLSDLRTMRATPQEREELSIRDGDLLVCEGGEPGRCAVWRGGKNALLYQKALHRIRTSSAVIPEVLMYRLRHDAENRQLDESFTGTTIKHLTRESLFRYEIPLPPLPEQKRIADKLDAALARVDACRERLDRVPASLKRFRQSVLAAAS